MLYIKIELLQNFLVKYSFQNLKLTLISTAILSYLYFSIIFAVWKIAEKFYGKGNR